MAIIIAMPKRPTYEIIFDEGVFDHLAMIERKFHSVTLETIEAQLSFEPSVETKNRKPLSEPNSFGVAWELRFGRPDNRFRIFYRIDDEAFQVRILALLVKRNNQLFFGSEAFEL